MQKVDNQQMKNSLYVNPHISSQSVHLIFSPLSNPNTLYPPPIPDPSSPFASSSNHRVSILQSYILNTMKKLIDLKQTYDSILSSPHPTALKKMMLEGVLAELKAMSSLIRTQNAEGSMSSNFKSDQTDTNCTGVSHLSLNSNDLSINSRILPSVASQVADREELEIKILQKQRIKITLNEQIENYEDDYFHFQKILLTKKEYHEALDDRIAKRSYEISKQSCQRSAAVVAQEEKKSLSYRFKNFFLL